MLSQEDYIVIKTLKARGVYNKDIAEELGVHPKTVSRALKRGKAPDKKRKKKPTKLDPYKKQVDQLMAEGVWNANVIFEVIKEAGYPGKITMLRMYMAPKRPLRKSRATVRFETEPGKQVQSDWGQIETEIAGEPVKVHFIVNTLGYSRRFHFWCGQKEDAEHTYEGIIRSFEYFGGVTKELLVDNQKTAVIDRVNGQVRFNERFIDLAGRYGFEPKACRPYRARTKGKVERMVGYIKDNFFQRYRSFESWAHLNQLAEKWLAEVADQRRHGTVDEIVSQRFEHEKASLGSLPPERYDTAYLERRQVAFDGYIEVKGNRYSVPEPYIGQTVTIRVGLDSTLRIFAKEQLIAHHLLQPRQQGWVTLPSHHRALWQTAVQVQQRSLDVYQEVASWN